MGSIFDSKANQPTDADLANAIGRSKRHWDALIRHLGEAHAGLTTEWKFYGAKHGWQLKCAAGKRAVLYLVPHEGGFLAATALEDAALGALRSSGLPPDLVREIENAKPAPEGRPARVEVTSKERLGIVEKLVAIKLGGQGGAPAAVAKVPKRRRNE